MTHLPDGWTVENIDSITRGGLISDGDWVESKDQDPSGQVRLTQLADVGDGDFRNRSDRWMNDEQASRLNVNYLKPGDLLLARMPDPLGRTCIVPENIGRAVTVVDVAIIRIVREDINPKFIMWLLNSPAIRQQIEMLASGTTRRRITRKNLGTIDLPVPPLPEQHKIVEILEDHLSRLDAALADVKQAKVKAAQFRRSFIHDMTSSIAGSEVMGILDICDVYQPKTISTKELISDGEFPVYGANGQIGFYDKYNHEESEVTVTCRGATCGTVNVIPPMSWITGNAMVFKPKDNRIQKGFLEYVLRGMDWTPVITGTAQPQITRTSIQDLFIDVPDPQIQQAIYMKLESALTQVLNASRLCENVENQVASLRRSLLQAAFTGQLTKEVASV
jgi:restriction endonuclease S subunit